MLRQRWSDRKARKNVEKHGVPFEEACTVFHDLLAVSYRDDHHSVDDDRHLVVGASMRGRLLVVTYIILDDDLPWLISARPAEPFERRRYMSQDELHDEGPPTKEMDDDCYVPPFDFSKGVRGRHYFPFVGITVMLDPDVAEYFPNDDMVNDALRILIGEGRATKQKPPLSPRLVS